MLAADSNEVNEKAAQCWQTTCTRGNEAKVNCALQSHANFLDLCTFSSFAIIFYISKNLHYFHVMKT